MATHSYNSRVTAPQRREVLRLADEGMSVRRIAAEVFGDARWRGRVERILKARSRDTPAGTDREPLEITGMNTFEVLTLFFERRMELIAASGGTRSMAELRNLLDVQRQLDAWARVERMKKLTNARESNEDG